jgi:hypothetical protein
LGRGNRARPAWMKGSQIPCLDARPATFWGVAVITVWSRRLVGHGLPLLVDMLAYVVA